MNSTIKAVLLIAYLLATFSCLKIKHDEERKNLIKNGGFENPSVQKWHLFPNNIPGWTSTGNIEVGKGSIYSDSWGYDDQIVELDSDKNVSITQNVNLDGPQICELRFKYASRTGDASSGLSVRFGGAEIFNYAAPDKKAREYTITVVGKDCENALTFAATGTSDSYGATINDVKIFCDPFEAFEGEIDKENNLIKNGGFEDPDLKGKWSIFNEINGWDATNHIEVGKGSIYVNTWGYSQVAELDANENTTISQIVQLEENTKCSLEFEYASRTGDQSSGLNVRWNGKLVYAASPFNKTVYTVNVKVLGKDGDNKLEFEGTGNSDSLGMTIDEVQLYCQKVAPINFDRNLVINGGFEHPNWNGSWRVQSAILGWEATNKIETGRGSIYVKDWGNTQICELDVYKNTTIKQRVLLTKKGKCEFRFKFASRTADHSSDFEVRFNGEKLYDEAPTDKKIYSKKFTVKANKGYNLIEFEGKGQSNRRGMTIDDVELYCQPGLSINYDKNYVINGNFEDPDVKKSWKLFNDINGWDADHQIEIGRGTLYANQWGNDNQIAELDSTQNIKLYQNITFDKVLNCFFNFKYASRTSNQSSAASVYFNGELLQKFQPTDNGIRYFSAVVQTKNGENKIEFHGEGPSNKYGMTIDDVELFCEDN